jgi:hypothetical protein
MAGVIRAPCFVPPLAEGFGRARQDYTGQAKDSKGRLAGAGMYYMDEQDGSGV